MPDDEKRTLTLTGWTCGAIHECLDQRVRDLAQLVGLPHEFSAATLTMLRKSLDEATAAYAEFEAEWFDSEERGDKLATTLATKGDGDGTNG